MPEVTLPAVTFRFDPSPHRYSDAVTGVIYPHISWLLECAGLVDDTWMSEESTVRGKAVHKLTADYDSGAIEHPEELDSKYKGWLLAHVKCMSILRPEILAIENPIVHPTLRFGGRPDRDVRFDGRRGTWELKSGLKTKAHRIQTALQAILISSEAGVPAEGLGRWCVYLKENGRSKVETHDNPADFVEARNIIKKFGQPIGQLDDVDNIPF